MQNNTTRNSLFTIIKTEFSDLVFRPSKRFSYRYPNTIHYENSSNSLDSSYLQQFLHELGHALSGHKNYKTDIERLKLEREAWDRAKLVYDSLSKKYPLINSIAWDQEFVESSLDTYRDWLHTKSRCPHCGLTRVQSADKKYHCPRCDNFS